jgi:exodeoxyribonuclease VII large subunit
MESGSFPGEIIFIPCTMQGDKVPRDIINALDIAMEKSADVIVISRGGGSAADLRWFDGEEIAIAIANCTIPVIAAIGHHEDKSIAEEISHSREKTPTAAADRILEIFRDTRSYINEKAHFLASVLDRELSSFQRLQSDRRERLNQAVESFFSNHKDHLSNSAHHLQRNFDDVYLKQRSRFNLTSSQLIHFGNAVIQKQSDLLFQKEQQLVRLDPSPWLDAGWTQLSLSGKNIKSTDEVQTGQVLQARLRDGVLKLTVNDTIKRT